MENPKSQERDPLVFEGYQLKVKRKAVLFIPYLHAILTGELKTPFTSSLPLLHKLQAGLL